MKKAIQYLLIILFGIVLLFLFLSCSTRKKIATKESVKTVYDTLIKRDSIFIEREKLIYLPTSNSEVITNPCDSTGKLKPINKDIKTPFGNVNLSSDGKGNLNIKATTDSISSVFEKQYHDRNQKQVQQISELQKENTTLKVIPFNWWKLIGLISLVTNGILIIILIIITLKYKLWQKITKIIP